jgi:mono/diheme cytochrome c family protein
MWFDAAERRSVLLRIVPLLLLAGCGPSDSQSSGTSDVATPAAVSAMVAAGNPRHERDRDRGRLLYLGSCSSCHGQRGQGMPHQGVDLRGSSFVARRSDEQLVTFLKHGRAPGDPESVQGLLMPPRGGNPALDDAALDAIVGFLRQLQQQAKGDAPPVAQLPRE